MASAICGDEKSIWKKPAGVALPASRWTSKPRLSMVFNGALTSLPPQVLVMSDPAGKTLKEMGYTQVHNLGGFKDWVAGGGAVEQV